MQFNEYACTHNKLINIRDPTGGGVERKGAGRGVEAGDEGGRRGGEGR